MSENAGIAFFLFIGAAGLLLLFVPLRKLLRHFTWKRAPATLNSTEIVYEIVGRYPMSGRMVATRGHVPKIGYQYEVEDHQYESKTIVDPLEEKIWFGSEAKAERFMDSMASDESATAIYNPNNPSESVLLNRLRLSDIVSVLAGCIVSTMFFYVALLLWPAAVPELDFPLYPNAKIHSYPDKEDERKFWTLSSPDDLDDVMTYYDANVDTAWQSEPSWKPGLPGSFYRVWVREVAENGRREEVTVRVQPEEIYVREGLEISIGYRTEPLDPQKK